MPAADFGFRMWKVEPQPWWEDAPGLMAFYPLCRHGKSAKQAVSYAAGAITAATPDTIIRKDLLSTLATFGNLVYENLDLMGIIGRDKMKGSRLYGKSVPSSSRRMC